MRTLYLVVLLPIALITACNVTGTRRRRAGDAGVTPNDDAPTLSVTPCEVGDPDACAGAQECVDGICVFPSSNDCGMCPAPGVCREDRCVTPDESGLVCEFDGECPTTEICAGGHCTHDPRIPRPCVAAEECGGILACVDGTCGCREPTDCPSGFDCEAGACVPDGSCVDDSACGDGWICDLGECRDGIECMETTPPLDGRWEMTSELNFREALSPTVSGLLDALERPFRFMSGELDCRDIGWSRTVEALACPLLDNARGRLPPWARSLLGAIANINQLLSTWYVTEELELTPTGIPDEYIGTRDWTRVRFEDRIDGRFIDPAAIADWRFQPEPFAGTASCGVLHVARHDVEFSLGAVIIWLVNTVIFEASDGRYGDLRSGGDALLEGLCGELGDLATSADPLIGVLVTGYCESELGDLLDDAVAAIEAARLDLSLLRLRGHAPIVGPRELSPGTWSGRLLSGDFGGSWEAWR